MTTPLPYHLHTRMTEFLENQFSAKELENQDDWWEESFLGVSHYWHFTIGNKQYSLCYDYRTDQISITNKTLH